MIKINPVYKKELKTSVRKARLSMIIFGFNTLLAIISLFAIYIAFGNVSLERPVGYTDVLSVYGVIAVIELGMVLFLIPGFASGAVSGERERQTLEILLAAKLKPIQIITGKLMSCVSSLILLVISSIPVIALVFMVGGISAFDILQLLLLIIITAVFIGSIGLFFSSLFKKTTVSTVFTYGSIIFLTAGTVAMMVLVYELASISVQNMGIVADSGNRVNLGNFPLILLVNPLISLASLLSSQFGGSQTFIGAIKEFGTCNNWILNHWYQTSLIVQLIAAFLLCRAGAWALNPLKRKKNPNAK